MNTDDIDFFDLVETIDTSGHHVRSQYDHVKEVGSTYNEGIARAKEEIGDMGFKNRFHGIPKSIMRFRKDPVHMDMVGGDENEVHEASVARGGGYAKALAYSTYNPSLARVLLDYFMPPGGHVLDPFMGRGTRSVMSYSLGMSYTGFDTCKETLDLNTRLLERARSMHGENGTTSTLHLGDGTELAPYANQADVFDGVFSCPPYYGIEQYSGAEGDLSHMADADFNERIRLMFRHLYRLVKPSGKYRPDIHPVLMTVGTVRHGEDGIVDMDSLFQAYAREAGFVLHDKVMSENLTPHAGFTFRRNWSLGFTTKAHETTLVWLKR